jgi:hypothetical protein
MSALDVGVRTAFVGVAIALWFWSQKAISDRKAPAPVGAGGIGDRLHALSTPWHTWFAGHPRGADALLIGTSAGIDLAGVYLLAASVFGDTLQPLLALVLVFAMRQLCQLLVSLPDAPGVIWRYPGFPSLLVTYHVENDYFFSGHTAVSVVAMLHVVHVAPPWLAAFAVALAAVEAGTVIVLRAHYTMDVFAAIVAACAAYVAAGWIAPGADSLLRGLT